MEAKKSKKADLENKKSLFFQLGLIITLIAVFMAFEYKSYDKQTIDDMMRLTDDTPEEITPITVQEDKPLPLPPTPSIIIHIVETTEEIIDDGPFIDVEANWATEIPVYRPVMTEEPPIVDDTPVTVPEFNPEFPGGLSNMYTYLSQNIKYPELAKQTGTQGIVYVNFVVETDGSISSVKVLRGIGGGCDEEAVRVVQSMPKWKPGMQFNKLVRVAYNIPVRFTLKY